MMAVLTDILIAPANDAPAIIAQWPGARRWPAFETTGLDWLMLADLAAALDEPSLVGSLEALDPTAFADKTNGPWVYVLPTALRDGIAQIATDDLGAVSARWSRGEEASARGLTERDAERLLTDIRALAIRARVEDKPMLLWVSL